MKFERADGRKIEVQVPKQLRPGDTFKVSPPALLVRVPEGVGEGQTVVFRLPEPGCENSHDDVHDKEGSFPGPRPGRSVADPGHRADSAATWYRAIVPQGQAPGTYFAVRMNLEEEEESWLPPWFNFNLPSFPGNFFGPKESVPQAKQQLPWL